MVSDPSALQLQNMEFPATNSAKLHQWNSSGYKLVMERGSVHTPAVQMVNVYVYFLLLLILNRQFMRFILSLCQLFC